MANFKNHNINVKDLLGFIPEALLSNLSLNTQIDYYAKVLHGKKMFYLLLYGILDNDRLSQRTLEDAFNDSVFKILFNLDENEKVRRSSISERLSKMDPDYFKQIYECIYEQFAKLYPLSGRKQHYLIRVDSSMVSEGVGKLMQGMDNKSGKKAVKYSIAFDGILPCQSEVFTTPAYGSEDIALPEVVMNHVKKETGHQNIYVLDRGLQSTRNMDAFERGRITFVCRAKENRKFIEHESFIIEAQDLDMGESLLIRDQKIQLYTGIPIINKQGKKHYRQELVDTPFRLVVVVKSKAEDQKEYWLLTNDFKSSTKQIAHAYRRRWDIEVFFRFLKQELNLSHFVSLNKNGIQVILYMTMIVAMMVLIYKKANNIGYKTAKRRLAMGVRDLAIAIIVVQCGGDPGLFFKT
ncbi:IS4 family transposase [Elizabethkingia anophelis]|uniref:IS4 family transposase n=1 Tax=Elizabethkingia anophelis TaxID=1117645 RepID=UPI000D048264|nr:IS4 family transposase [Elizabethkingia anophelis]MCL1689425.1 IS4 family transposase [Elizabethkingia anophelis]MDV4009444.1 transposase [Elizabethkingia anophelis]MYY46366.1 IS4 family transposase [Elizabethkingia anophelis]PRQ84108.1 transposase [Elizabethkingia anophelis]PRQ85008.1 transposase [Elizabethkingia anophelis]